MLQNHEISVGVFVLGRNFMIVVLVDQSILPTIFILNEARLLYESLHLAKIKMLVFVLLRAHLL
jgi:hypothetical protein